MFSVVIPLYNKELSVKNTIQSVLDQTFQEFEIVIVNDGSTDDSVTVVESFNDSRIRLIHQKNQGVSAARNKGIAEARNEWICFLDADDLWEEEHLYCYYKVINELPYINWILSGYLSKSKNHTKEIVYTEHGIIENVFGALLNGLSIHTSTVCVRRKVFNEYEDLYFRLGMNNSEDREVWYKLCCIDKRPYYIGKALSTYDSYVPNSLTKLKSGVDKEHFLTMKNRLEEFVAYKELSSKDKRSFVKFNALYIKKLIWGRYLKGALKESHREYIKGYEYFLMKNTSWLPVLFRRIIYKFYRIVTEK